MIPARLRDSFYSGGLDRKCSPAALTSASVLPGKTGNGSTYLCMVYTSSFKRADEMGSNGAHPRAKRPTPKPPRDAPARSLLGWLRFLRRRLSGPLGISANQLKVVTGWGAVRYGSPYASMVEMDDPC